GSKHLTRPHPLLAKESFKVRYPYFSSLIFKESMDIPDFPAINKWAKPARISFSLTRNGENPFMEDAPRASERLQEFITPLLPHVSETVSRINATLQTLMGKDALNFDADAYTYQQAEGQGRIHIMFFSDSSAYERSQYIKRSKSRLEYRNAISEKKKELKVSLDLDRHIPYPILFTPQSDKQVEGHFFVNPQNEIQAAVCYIPTFVSQEMQQHLIDECLLRSMGMPDPILNQERLASRPAFLLGYWNDFDKWDPQRHMRLKEGKLSVSGITDVDLLLLKILYQPEVKTGMTMKQFFQLFNAVEPAAEAPATP
ncbi:MAG TPA: hypothetical protein VHP34_00075, partial [Alphaproteobacteria bacterium]|nr:hypothetical protein [Alphaproteobacteria bacterium]